MTLIVLVWGGMNIRVRFPLVRSSRKCWSICVGKP